MRAILIDARSQTVREIEIEPEAHGELLKAIYAAIGCRWVERVRLDDHDLWIDAERRTNGTESGFSLAGRPFFGSGLILGHDDHGRSTAATMNLSALQRHVDFWIVVPSADAALH